MSTIIDTARGLLLWARVALESRLRSFHRRQESDERALVIFASHFIPGTEVGVIRVLELARYADNNGWRVVVITDSRDIPETEASRYLSSRLPDSVTVIPVSAPEWRPSWRWFPRVDGNFLTGLSAARIFQKTFSGKSPAVVVASGPEFHSFVAAMYAACSSGTRLVLDYRDEWTLNPRTVTELGNSDQYWEARCLKAASGVVFLNDEVAALYRGQYRTLVNRPTAVVNNGWDPEEFESWISADVPEHREKDVIRIDFIGFVGNHQRPDEFLDAIGAVARQYPLLAEKLVVEFTGPVQPHLLPLLHQYDESVPGLIRVCGNLPKHEAVRKACESECLLVINNPEMLTTLPVKLIEYMATRRPILVYGEGGPIQRVVEECGSGIIVSIGDVTGLADAIKRLCREPLSHWVTKEREGWVEAHRRQCVMETFLQFIGSLSRK